MTTTTCSVVPEAHATCTPLGCAADQVHTITSPHFPVSHSLTNCNKEPPSKTHGEIRANYLRSLLVYSPHSSPPSHSAGRSSSLPSLSRSPHPCVSLKRIRLLQWVTPGSSSPAVGCFEPQRLLHSFLIDKARN